MPYVIIHVRKIAGKTGKLASVLNKLKEIGYTPETIVADPPFAYTLVYFYDITDKSSIEGLDLQGVDVQW